MSGLNRARSSDSKAGLPGARPRLATIVQSSFRKCPVGWVIAETDNGCRELVHADRFVVIEPEHA
jgi:hypothetical protein